MQDFIWFQYAYVLRVCKPLYVRDRYCVHTRVGLCMLCAAVHCVPLVRGDARAESCFLSLGIQA